MLKQLKMYSLRKVLVWVLVTLVVGAVFLVMSVPGVVMLAKGPAYLDLSLIHIYPGRGVK